MVGLLTSRHFGPIGVDLGSRSVKLVQLSADGRRLVECSSWEVPGVDAAAQAGALTEALAQARGGRRFRGRHAVVCLGSPDLYVQNLRIPKPPGGDLEPIARREAEERIALPAAETEMRFLDAADVRQGDSVRREVIALACHRPVLLRTLAVIEGAGLRPVCVDVEPAAMLRCYVSQLRRDDDLTRRVLYVHLGNTKTIVLIAQGRDVLFIKYLDIGGRNLDEAVARHLQMDFHAAWALRRHNGDRRADQQDPDVAHSVAEATRAVIDRLANEVSLCVRYHSVTFRGQPLTRLVLGGGEATPAMVERFAARLDLRCELGDPFRSLEQSAPQGRRGQWDVALGLALRRAR